MSSERLVRTAALLSTPSGEETILVLPATSRFYSLSPAGSSAWDALAHRRTEAEVVAYALAPFPHTPSPPPARPLPFPKPAVCRCLPRRSARLRSTPPTESAAPTSG
jgi:hypothetical protein